MADSRGTRYPWGVSLARFFSLALVAVAVLGPVDAAAKPPKTPSAETKKARPKATAKRVTPTKAAPVDPVSLGRPNEGQLKGGVRLDTKLKYVRVVPYYESGDVRWGLPSLVRMIERSAKAVAKKYPGSVLDVGDLSQKNGGDLLRHHSHESGRDADLGFYVVDAKGKPVKGGAKFHKVNGDDLSVEGLPGARFDVARNWLFVQTMLGDAHARVSHIFVDDRIKKALLEHARKTGVSRRTLDRAAVVMMQPSDSVPHDDHFHVRISCPSSMRGACLELSKGAPTGRARAGVRTAAKAKPKASKASGDAPAKVVASAPKSRPASPEDLAEAEADAAEVKPSLDEVGLVKITD